VTRNDDDDDDDDDNNNNNNNDINGYKQTERLWQIGQALIKNKKVKPSR
jgi:hypothetical protein